jgi:hypothetical protein
MQPRFTIHSGWAMSRTTIGPAGDAAWWRRARRGERRAA